MSIIIENVEVFGWEAAIRGARNLMNSWKESDSRFFDFGSSEGAAEYKHFHTLGKEQVKLPMAEGERLGSVRDLIGQEDYMLLMNMSKGGSEESKWRRMIHVQLDITAPLYWWKEFDTYKVGTVSNSCSTMHKLASTPITKDCFEMDDFSNLDTEQGWQSLDEIQWTSLINWLEDLRRSYNESKDKRYWKELIRLLPDSWLQRRTVTMNYEKLLVMCSKGQRRNHKLTEWSKSFIDWARSLPYAQELIFIDELEDKNV